MNPLWGDGWGDEGKMKEEIAGLGSDEASGVDVVNKANTYKSRAGQK